MKILVYLNKALEVVKEVNKKNNDSMGKYTLSKKKLNLQELCSKHINLMEPHRKLVAIYKDLNVLNFEQKVRKE